MIPADHIDSLLVAAKAWFRRFPRKQLKVPPLSHCTGVTGLLGICSTNGLWATCAQYSNDISEGVYAQSIASEVMENFFQNRPLTESGQVVKSFLELQMGRKGAEVGDVYITSFCESSDLLSQWRAYGKTAGFEIRFDSLTKPQSPFQSEAAQ